MPKIIINELDLTKPGSTAYSNFSVVVPGFVANEDLADTVFDENGVYEVSSQDEFVANIGKVNPNVRVAMREVGIKGATVKAIIRLGKGVEGANPPSTTSANTVEFAPDTIDYFYNGTSYATLDEARDAYLADTGEKDASNFDPTMRLNYHDEVEGAKARFNRAMTIAFKHATDIEKASWKDLTNSQLNLDTDLDDSYHFYFASPSASEKIGYLTDGIFNYTQITDDEFAIYTKQPKVEGTTLVIDDSLEVSYDFTTSKTNSGADNPCEFYIIYEGEEGSEGIAIVEDIIHYGNQIAYELLGLGYTVLYKRMRKDFKLSEFGLDWARTVQKAGNKTEGTVNVLNADETLIFSVGTEDEPKYVTLVDSNTFTIDGYRAFDLASATTEIMVDKKAVTVPYGKSVLDQLSDFDGFWSCLKDKSTYDFRYIVNGLTTNNAEANNTIAQLATFTNETVDTEPAKAAVNGRGDCIALLDIDTKAYTGAGRNTQATAIPEIVKEVGLLNKADKFSAIFAPSVTYNMTEDADYGNNRTFPGSFHYLACAAKSAESYNEWYANAGMTRGLSNFVIESTGVKLGEIAIQALEPRYQTPNAGNPNRSVNLIVKIKDNFYLWGNRTAHALGIKFAADGELVASHFLNIRQLCCTLKKQIYIACRRFTFDPNSNLLWINFCSMIKPTLEKMKADQGIKDYKFVKDPTDKKALLKAKVRIVPIEAVEDFDITVTLEDSLSGNVEATIEE